MRRVILGAFSAACALLSACQYDPHSHLYTTEEPKDADLAGTYTLEKFFLPTEAGTNAPAITVELRTDGTFVAKNVPRWQHDEPAAGFFATLISGEGRWKKGKVGGRSDGKDLWGVYLHAPDDRFLPAGLTGDKAPYGLIFGLGDPDGGYALLLKKQTANKRAPSAPESAEAAPPSAAGGAQSELERLRALPDSPEKWRRIEELVREWAKTDPEGAAAYAGAAVAAGAPDAILRAAVQAWAERNPLAASQWAARLENENLRTLGTQQAFRTWAASDPAAAAAQLAYLPAMTGDAGPCLILEIADVFAKKDLESSIAWAASQQGQLRDYAMGSVAGTWSERDPAKTAQWLAYSAEPKFFRRFGGVVVARWASADPVQAAWWSLQVQDPENRQIAVEMAASFMAHRNEPSAATWAQSIQDVNLRDVALKNYAESAADKDPATAVQWASTIASPEARGETLRRVFFEWGAKDPAAASEFLRTTSVIDDETRAKLQQP